MDSGLCKLCRHFLFSLTSQRWQKQQHSGLLGNNCADWGPRLPPTTMVCIISHLWGWLDLRSLPFMSTGPHLLLRTLALLFTSCHYQHVDEQSWFRALKQKPGLILSQLFELAVIKFDEYIFLQCWFSSGTPYWCLCSFISWVKVANVALKRELDSEIGCVSHGQIQHLTQYYWVIFKNPSQVHALSFHGLFLILFFNHSKSILYNPNFPKQA